MSLPDKTIIQQLLKAYPESRDDEHRLYELYVSAKGMDVEKVKFAVVIFKMKKGKLCSFESIARMRRMIQMKEPALRGENYGHRKEMEKKVKRQMIEEKPINTAIVNSNIDNSIRRQDTPLSLFP
jgi:hypothetical protein